MMPTPRASMMPSAATTTLPLATFISGTAPYLSANSDDSFRWSAPSAMSK
jgi:hypothetical protein